MAEPEPDDQPDPTGSELAGPDPIRIIDLLELARRQEWVEINGIITFFDTARLRRLADFLAVRAKGETYRVNGYYLWERAIIDLLQRVNNLIAARDSRDDWQYLERAEI
jgi:hypothetical protein